MTNARARWLRSSGRWPARWETTRTRLVNGEGFIELVEIALATAMRNAAKLLDLDTIATARNLMFKILQQVVLGILEAEDERGLVSRDVFLDIAKRVLPVVSANLEPLLADQPDIVKRTVVKAIALAHGALENRISGENLPELIERMLKQALWDELNLDEPTAVKRAATDILRAA